MLLRLSPKERESQGRGPAPCGARGCSRGDTVERVPRGVRMFTVGGAVAAQVPRTPAASEVHGLKPSRGSGAARPEAAE